MLLETRDFIYNNIVSFVLLLPIIFLSVMCMIDFKRTKYLFNTLVSNKYFYTYSLDLTATLSVYNLFVIALISQLSAFVIVFSFFNEVKIYNSFLSLYFKFFIGGFIYYILKYICGKIYSFFINVKDFHKQMFALEFSYLTSALLLVFPFVSYGFLHLNSYNIVSKIVLFVVVLFYSLRVFLLLKNNKNLLSGKLIYIILYLCILEIFPFIYFYERYTE